MDSTIRKGVSKKLLLGAESPFVWKIPSMDLPAELFITAKSEKCENIDEETEFKWTTFILNIVMAFELCEKKKKYSEAIEHINTCVSHLKDLDSSHCKDILYYSIRPAVWHVTLATYGHLLQKLPVPSPIVDLITLGVAPVHKMKSWEIAGIYGIKAAFFLQYGTEGHRLALEYARTARDLDPSQAEWAFLVGNALGRIRRIENGTISTEELSAIEKAYSLQRTAAYTVYLAQIYGEYSKHLFYNANGSTEDLQKRKEYSTKSVDYFMKALKIRPNCASLMARVAHGLLRANNKEARVIPYTKNLLDKVVSLTPNNAMVYHDLGLYYQKFECNAEKSLQNLQRSNELGNIKALLHLTGVKWTHGRKNEIIADLKRGLDQYKAKERQAELLTCIGAAYLLVEDNWPDGVRYLVESLQVDPSARYPERYSGFNGKKINLLRLVMDELLSKGLEGNYLIYIPFIRLMKNLRPDMFNEVPKSGTFDAWKQEQMSAGQRRQNSANTSEAVGRRVHHENSVKNSGSVAACFSRRDSRNTFVSAVRGNHRQHSTKSSGQFSSGRESTEIYNNYWDD